MRYYDKCEHARTSMLVNICIILSYGRINKVNIHLYNNRLTEPCKHKCMLKMDIFSGLKNLIHAVFLIN